MKAFEGCLSPIKGKRGFFKPYLCPANVLTIGWGHTNHHEPRFNKDTVWSQAQCDDGLRADLKIFEDRVSKLAPEVKDQHRFDALVSWAYNTGGPSKSGVWDAARKGDVAATVSRLSQWNKAKGKVLAGLVRRRKAEAELFSGQATKALKTAGVKPLPMAQAVDHPQPPKALIDAATTTERAVRTSGTAVAGAGTGAEVLKTSTGKPDFVGFPSYVAYSAIGLGIAAIIIAVILISRKRAKVEKTFA